MSLKEIFVGKSSFLFLRKARVSICEKDKRKYKLPYTRLLQSFEHRDRDIADERKIKINIENKINKYIYDKYKSMYSPAPAPALPPGQIRQLFHRRQLLGDFWHRLISSIRSHNCKYPEKETRN